MRWVFDTRPVFFGLDLAVKIAGDGFKLANHEFEISDLAGFLFSLEALQAKRGFAWLHGSIPHTCSNACLNYSIPMPKLGDHS
jgi:hypothetical protein